MPAIVLPAVTAAPVRRRLGPGLVEEFGSTVVPEAANAPRAFFMADDPPPVFLHLDFPYPSVHAYLNAFVFWRNYVPPPALPAGDDPVALEAAVAQLDARTREIETEFNVEIPRVWEATSFNVAGQRCLIWGASLAIVGAVAGGYVGGPYGAIIGAAIGAVVGVVMGLFPWEASAFLWNWTEMLGSMTVEERYGLWRNAHEAMNTARRTQGQEAPLDDTWQFSTNRTHILTGPVTDLTFLCFDRVFEKECFPMPPGGATPTSQMEELPPVARYALGILASTETAGAVFNNAPVQVQSTYWWRKLMAGSVNAWLKPILAPFATRTIASIRHDLRLEKPGFPEPLPSMRDQPIPQYVAAAIAVRSAALVASIPPRSA